MKNRKGYVIVASDKELNALISREVSYALSNALCNSRLNAAWYGEYCLVLCSIIKPLALGIINRDDACESVLHYDECRYLQSLLSVADGFKGCAEHVSAVNDAFDDLFADGKLDFMIESTLLEFGIKDSATMDAMKGKLHDIMVGLKESYKTDDKRQCDILRNEIIK